jgi:GntR family transcriptional regulator
MMRLWLSKNGEVPLREQLETQIVLGIISDDLKPAERLPSTRDLARRHRIHANTVSAVYRSLARSGWVEFRKGSGVYVRPRGEGPPLDTALDLDQLTAGYLRAARSRGYSLAEIQSRLERWLALQPPDHFLVIESDSELRRILIAEIEELTAVRALSASPDSERRPDWLAGAVPVAMYGQAEKVSQLLPAGSELLLLRTRSMPESLSDETRPPRDSLITVASSWPDFLQRARTVLVAAGLDPDALSFRDARRRGWERGLRNSLFVITDSLTARSLPRGCPRKVFRIISDASAAVLRDCLNPKTYLSGRLH